MPCDVSDTDAARRLVEQVVGAAGRLDVLVNNAGTAVTKDALSVTEEEFDKVMAVNLRAYFFLAQAAARKMVEQGGGKIINVASIFGLVGSRSILPYCVSKGGVVLMTKALALEWARYNIRVNAVAPGYVKTSMNETELSDEKILSAILRRIPLRRLGTAEDVAGLVLYLASDASDYVTGAVFTVDGGWTAE
jgi:NAD(P)-dependent dehydrogenase (short-subunit alcohol dehydrogenase family)